MRLRTLTSGLAALALTASPVIAQTTESSPPAETSATEADTNYLLPLLGAIVLVFGIILIDDDDDDEDSPDTP